MAQTRCVGLALSGGAALGAAHIGVIEILEEAGIEADVVAGTSIGAIVGAAYIADKIGDLRRLAEEMNRWRLILLADPQFARGGLLGGARIMSLLSEHFGEADIDSLPRPFAVVATDLVSGEEWVFRSGSLLRALRASMAVPGVFEPLVHGDAVLADGGLAQPLPVGACRRLGADRVIAVNLLGDAHGVARSRGMLPGSTRKATPLDSVMTSLTTLAASLTRANLAIDPADVVIKPRTGDFKPHEFDRASELIERGRRAARAALPAIRACLAGRDRCSWGE